MLTTKVTQLESADSEWPRVLGNGDKPGIYKRESGGWALKAHGLAICEDALAIYAGGTKPFILPFYAIGPVTPCPPGTSITITQGADRE